MRSRSRRFDDIQELVRGSRHATDNPVGTLIVQHQVKRVATFSVYLALLFAAFEGTAFGRSPSWIVVNSTRNGFVLSGNGTTFVPWGFNYFRDDRSRLLEDYWNGDGPRGWSKVDKDFRAMKRLGANVVRVPLQFARFMDAPRSPNQRNLARLAKLVDLAENVRLYLDVTGLGTFRVSDVPPWYRDLSEQER